ncbi:UTP--glucose-1-phosphate uridylyltransferase [Armadillidium vulgare]|nr:UTP--glucose-1-phosphate uridylyltransferase [Armadillidium vulgare]
MNNRRYQALNEKLSRVDRRQLYSLHRSPSMEFKELTKKDAQLQLATEIQRLLHTSNSSVKEQIEKELEGFERLFGRFINESGSRIEWERIQKLPDGVVRSLECGRHGDFYEAFANSGLLQEFIKQGKEYVFISNIDNLGATVDVNILKFLLDTNIGHCEFLMEVTDKTRADVKRTLHMEIIVNNKTLENGLNIIQLEQAVGAAIKCFEGSMGVVVPRSRFLPVKKTDDLLLVMSNLYSLQNGSLIMSPLRMFPTTPLVKLGPNHFGKVKDYLSRFQSIPDMLELDHITVSGDVTFGKGVSLKGTVIIIANHGDRIDIPPGAVLENKIVSGNLRILDH